MASRSLGELLLRPATFTQTSRRVAAPSWTAQRCLSSTPRQLQQPQPKDAFSDFMPKADAQRPRSRYVPEREADHPQAPAQAQPQESRQQPSPIDSLFGGMGSNRPPPPYMPRSASNASPEARSAQATRVFGSEFSSQNRMRPAIRRPGLDFESMALPDSDLNPSLSNKPSDAASLATQQEQTFVSYPRLNPTYGRTVDLDVSRGRDIVRGIGMLGSLMARNKVKADFNKQRFHERGGLKRKRLASERWRARFKAGFKEVTGRVSELTKKGW